MNSDQEFDFAQDTYRTGSVQPPKSHSTAVSVLLALVIFLLGLSTALGLMNIRLLDALKQSDGEAAPVAFSDDQQEPATEDICFCLGFAGQEVPEFWRVYQDLPLGIYITDVEDGSDAARKGVLPGDILTHVDGQHITTADQLHSLLKDHNAPVQARFFRDGKQLELTLAIED